MLKRLLELCTATTFGNGFLMEGLRPVWIYI